MENAEKHSEDEQSYLKSVIDSLKAQLEQRDKEYFNLKSGSTERDDEVLRQVEHLQQEKRALLEDMDELRSQFKHKEKECRRALESEDELMEQKKNLQRMLDRKDREISRANEENEELERKLRKNKEDVLSPTESGPVSYVQPYSVMGVCRHHMCVHIHVRMYST